jgi:hypothetical protein
MGLYAKPTMGQTDVGILYEVKGMNERIKELWSLSRNPSGRGHNEEKFAELIIRECVNRVRSRQMLAIEDEQNVNHAFDLLIYDIESHFGVEE